MDKEKYETSEWTKMSCQLQPKRAKEFQCMCIVFIKRLYIAKWQSTTRAAGGSYVYHDFIVCVFVLILQNYNYKYWGVISPINLISNLLNNVEN